MGAGPGPLPVAAGERGRRSPAPGTEAVAAKPLNFGGLPVKTLATLALLLLLAPAASAAVVHDEAVDGDLSSDPAAPTPLAFAISTPNVIHGTTGNPGTVDRDYITFTLAPGEVLLNLRLLAFSPDNLAFASFNAGPTSFVPGAATNASFLAGIHVSGAMVGENLMPFFVTESVTTSSLAVPFLEAGAYCFLIQQTSAIAQSYSLEFEVLTPLPARENTWGTIKSLYR